MSGRRLWGQRVPENRSAGLSTERRGEGWAWDLPNSDLPGPWYRRSFFLFFNSRWI